MDQTAKRELIKDIKALQVYPAIKLVLERIVNELGAPLPPDAIEVANADNLMLPGMFKDKEDNA